MNAAVQKSIERSLSVLVLEDEPLIALDLRFAFEDQGVEVHLAASCEDAHAIVGETVVDGAVLDVNLGRGETCEAVANTLRERAIPFILHTGDLDRHGEAIRKLDALVIPKPTPAMQVAQAILNRMEQSS